MTKNTTASGERFVEEVDAFFIQQRLVAENAQSEIVHTIPHDERISYEGNVIFENEVATEGRIIWIGGDARFKARVRDSTIACLGKVFIESEAYKSTIHSKDMISVSTCMKSDLLSMRDIELLVQSECSSLTGTGNINGARASVRGGKLVASRSIYLSRAQGLGTNNRLSLICGTRKPTLRRIQLLQKDIATAEQDLLNVKQSVQLFVRKLLERNLLGAKIPAFEELKKHQARLEQEIAAKKAALAALEADSNFNDISKRPEVVVYSRIGDNVIIEIGDIRYEAAAGSISTKFESDGNNIRANRINDTSRTE